jgi:hypothetical protein
MKALQELVQLVTRYKRRQIQILGYEGDGDSRYETFYNLIADGVVQDDEEAAEQLFGGQANSKSKPYLNFKRDFFRRLVNTVFFIDLKQPEFNDRQQAAVNCWRNLAAMKILMARGARNSAIMLAEKTLGPAQKYELTEIVLELSRALKWYAAATEGKTEEWHYYQSLADESAEIMAATARAQSMYEELVMPFVASKSPKPWLADKAKGYLAELRPHFQRLGTFQLSLYYYLIARLEKEVVHDYQGIVALCCEAIQHFEAMPAAKKTTVALFSHAQVTALAMLGNFVEGEKIAQRAEACVTEGTHNWYKGREQHLILRFYKRDYDGAFDIYQVATEHKGFRFLSEIEQENWRLYGGFIQLLAQAGKIYPERCNGKLRSFKLKKFLNEIPVFSKDKRGKNIPLLIIHALFLLHLDRYEEAYDRMSALDKYADRHLKETPETLRSYYFIKALLQTQKAGFLRDTAEAKGAPLLERMSAMSSDFATSPCEVEVIPYEHLWEIAMEGLRQRSC